MWPGRTFVCWFGPIGPWRMAWQQHIWGAGLGRTRWRICRYWRGRWGRWHRRRRSWLVRLHYFLGAELLWQAGVGCWQVGRSSLLSIPPHLLKIRRRGERRGRRMCPCLRMVGGRVVLIQSFFKLSFYRDTTCGLTLIGRWCQPSMKIENWVCFSSINQNNT